MKRIMKQSLFALTLSIAMAAMMGCGQGKELTLARTIAGSLLVHSSVNDGAVSSPVTFSCGEEISLESDIAFSNFSFAGNTGDSTLTYNVEIDSSTSLTSSQFSEDNVLEFKDCKFKIQYNVSFNSLGAASANLDSGGIAIVADLSEEECTVSEQESEKAIDVDKLKDHLSSISCEDFGS